jgi:hypothetical protein
METHAIGYQKFLAIKVFSRSPDDGFDRFNEPLGSGTPRVLTVFTLALDWEALDSLCMLRSAMRLVVAQFETVTLAPCFIAWRHGPRICVSLKVPNA